MPHHFQKWVEEADAWCNTCGRLTKHIVSGGRIGRCKEHQSQELTEAQKKRREKEEREKRQGRLF